VQHCCRSPSSQCLKKVSVSRDLDFYPCRSSLTAWALDAQSMNPRRSSSITILEDGTQSETDFQDDANGNGILDRPSRVVLQYGHGEAVARTDISHDEGSRTDVPSNTVGHNPAFSSARTVRGSPASVVQYADPGSGSGGSTDLQFCFQGFENLLHILGGRRVKLLFVLLRAKIVSLVLVRGS
jgi:hypothetical protein